MPSPDDGAAGRRGKRRRLTRSADFDRAFRQGRSFAGRHLVLHAFPRAASDAADATVAGDGALPRLGVSVGRRVGGAVARNRVKRLLREAFWALAATLPDGYDFVVVARPGAAELAEREGADGFEAALRALLDESGLGTAADRGERAADPSDRGAEAAGA